MPTAQQMLGERIHKLLEIGAPKGAGKSTFAMTAPTPIALIQFDPGDPVVPPGVDGSKIFVKTYPSATDGITPDSINWKRAKDVGEDICRDFLALRKGVLGKADIVISPTEAWPLPRTIVLDGLPSMDGHIINWLLAKQNATTPDDLGNPQAFWGDRLVKNMTLLMAILPLPVNVILTTWSEPEMREITNTKGKKERVTTGRIIPMLGGQLLRRIPGEVDASVFCYSRLLNVDGKGVTRYYVRTRPNGLMEECGVRNGYTMPDEIDVTITPGKHEPLPWQRLWGKEG